MDEESLREVLGTGFGAVEAVMGRALVLEAERFHSGGAGEGDSESEALSQASSSPHSVFE